MGFVESVVAHLDFASGLYALLGVIVLIILYLIKQKPIDKTLPSLLFLIKQEGKSRFFFMLRRFVTDAMFLLHLLIILLLAFAIAQPFIRLNLDVSSQNTVLVLDTSASSASSSSVLGSRMDKIKSAAKENLNGEVSIVLVGTTPDVALETGSKREANELINTMKSTAEGSNIGDAMLTAASLLEGKDGRVVVISDFIATEGPDPFKVRNMLISRGMIVDFIAVGSDTKNVGFVERKAASPQSTVYIKNYNDGAVSLPLEINGVRQDLRVLANSIEPVTFDLLQGTNKLKIDAKDGMLEDNILYISNPEVKVAHVLLITNNKDERYITSVLHSISKIELVTASPPILPDLSSFDLIVVGSIDQRFIIPGTYKNLAAAVESGVSLVLTAQDALFTDDLAKILPVEKGSLVGSTKALVGVENQVTRDLNFGSLEQHYATPAKEGTTRLVVAEDNSTLVGISSYGKGSVVYYGLIEDKSDFKASTDYPLFWNNLVNFLEKRNDLQYFNVPAGTIFTYPTEKTISTPTGQKTGRIFRLNQPGIYTIDEREYAVNVLNVLESDIGLVIETPAEEQDYKLEKVTLERKIDLGGYLAAIALLLLLFELYIIKFRGEL